MSGQYVYRHLGVIRRQPAESACVLLMLPARGRGYCHFQAHVVEVASRSRFADLDCLMWLSLHEFGGAEGRPACLSSASFDVLFPFSLLQRGIIVAAYRRWFRRR